MAASFQTQRLVEFHDTDMAGIMHFASFFQYMESAEHELIRSLGFSVHFELDGHRISFPRVSATCDYKSPVKSEDILDIAVTIARLGSKSVTYEFLFTHDGREVALGKMTSVCCRLSDKGPLQSIAVPDEIADKLRPFSA